MDFRSSRKTLGCFIPRPENLSAWAAVRRLAEELRQAGDSAINPLFIYGPSGCGKTHLVGGLADALGKSQPKLRIQWVSADEASSFDGAENFDVLIVEDVHRLADDAATANQLCSILDEARAFGRQVILTSLRGPHSFRNISTALSSRLTQGLAVGIESFGADSRRAVFHELAAREGVPFSEPALAWLVRRLSSRVREWEGFLGRLRLTADHPPRPPLRKGGSERFFDLESVTRAWVAPQASESSRLTAINDRVARYFQVPSRSLRSGRREMRLLLPRQVGMFLAREMTQASMQNVGTYFGKRDHTTVLHACRKIRQELKKDLNLQSTLRELRLELEGEFGS